MRTTSKSSITTKSEADCIELETPGEVLRIDFMEPMGVTGYRLAKSIDVPQTYISKVLHGGGVSPELGLLLDRYFGLSEGWWSRLQAEYDSRMAKRKLGDHIDRVQPWTATKSN